MRDALIPTMVAPTPSGPEPGTLLRTLRGLAGYRCGHSGSCCRAGWPIPVEAAPLRVLTEAGLRPVTVAHDGTGAVGYAAILGRTPEHACVAHDPTHSNGGCSLERALGPKGLPYSCRQFPRVLLGDGRGWHVSLSAWCGTAAALLASGGVAGVDFLSYDHISADERVHVEGLDARDAWPPFLRPGVLAGLEAYDAWERRILLEWLAPGAAGRALVHDALADALRWTEWVRNWRAADGSLEARVARPWLRRPPHRPGQAATNPADVLRELRALVPETWRPTDWPAGLTDASFVGVPVTEREAHAALARYLGTRLLGSWVAYQGQGVRSVLASLCSSLALVSLALTAHPGPTVSLGQLRTALRAADWLQLHLLDRDQWAAWCAAWEDERNPADLLSLVGASGDLLIRCGWVPSVVTQRHGPSKAAALPG